MKGIIRAKLVTSLLAVVIITGIGSIFINFYVINKNIMGQAQEDVQSHLNTAQHIYNEKINVINLFMEHLSSLTYIQTAIVQNDRELLAKKLRAVKEELNIDILNITDATGKVLVRARSNLYGDDVSDDSMIQHVLTHRKGCAGSNIISRQHLQMEGKDLSDRAFIQVIPTPMARKISKQWETQGMMIEGAAPIFDNNKLIGVVYGGMVLNNHFELVDRIKELVFKERKVKGFEIGTVTIFMDDLRISTNVKYNDGKRAVGTQVSEEVYNEVIGNENVWLDRAFVVSNWYLSGYSPIYNIDDKVIGILYVGILEEKYNIIKKSAAVYSLIVILVTAILAVGLSAYLVRTIMTPIHTLVNASTEIANGNYDNKVEINSKDELGYLCTTFNHMLDAISERDKKLKEQTERQIVQSEKLASLGRLASGIAHEINNPLTGVLSYSTALYDDLAGTPYQEDIKVIIDETIRCRSIVKSILEFARETRLEKRPENINKIIRDALAILEKHVNFQNIRINKNLTEDLPLLNLDANQMRSVINNLTVNAADAMPNGGELRLSTSHDKENGEVVIEVADSGVGISAENMNKIFYPFFTTKETGTGLGLAVTYGIVKKHNGTITVKSVEGEGTTFTIRFPVSKNL